MSPATAYSYLASKDHLFAELLWRRLATDRGPELPNSTATERLSLTIEYFIRLIQQAPATAAAATKSLLGADPQVAQLRPRIGGIFIDRFREAIGDGADPRLLDIVSMTFFGALLQAGMGLGSYEECGRRLQDAVAVILKGAG